MNGCAAREAWGVKELAALIVRKGARPKGKKADFVTQVSAYGPPHYIFILASFACRILTCIEAPYSSLNIAQIVFFDVQYSDLNSLYTTAWRAIFWTEKY